MAKGHVGSVLYYIRQIVGARTPSDSSDGQLLERFVTHRDEAAFEGLFQRYAPMVLAVCQRILQDRCDAEDACQATFLVFARKASSVRAERSAAGWLYQVAYHLAVKAKANAAKRRIQERGPVDMRKPDPEAEAARREVRAVLDEELHRLPEKYRTPLILCYLHGKSAREAARELGWPEGSMPKRLERALELLRQQLTRRGVVLAGTAFATVLAESASAAVVPAALGDSMVKAALMFAAGKGSAGVVSAHAACLAEGMLKTMFMSKLKIAAALLLAVGVAGTGTGVLVHQALADRPAAANQAGTNKGTEGKARRDAPTILLADVVAYEKDKSLTVEALTTIGKRSLEFAIEPGKTEMKSIGGALTNLSKPPSDIAVGMQASVWADKDNPKKAARIVANTKAPTAAGEVLAYEDGKSITIEAAFGTGKKKLEFAIGKDMTEFRLLQGAKAIAVGMSASVWADKDDPKKAALIEARSR